MGLCSQQPIPGSWGLWRREDELCDESPEVLTRLWELLYDKTIKSFEGRNKKYLINKGDVKNMEAMDPMKPPEVEWERAYTNTASRSPQQILRL